MTRSLPSMHPFTRERSRRLTACAAVTLGLLGATGATADAHSGDRVAAAAGARPVVAVVDSVSGPISVRDSAAGPLRALRRGASLHLGDIVVPGNGGTAVLLVHRPVSVSPDANLIFIKPATGVRPKLTLSGEPSLERVTISR